MEKKSSAFKRIIKDTLILFTITLIAGLCLGAVEKITREPIKKAQREAKEKAYMTVFDGADSFESTKELEELLKNSEDILKDNGYSQTEVTEAVAAYKDEQIAGYVLTVTNYEGYGGEITLVVGIGCDGVIKGYEVLAINETPGLGMNAKEDEFKNQYAGKKAIKLSWTKTGASKANEVDAISGATITTKAVNNAVNAASALITDEEKGLISLEEGEKNE